MEELKEFFTLPINQVKLGTIFGTDLYTSDTLKQKFIQAIESTEYNYYLPNISNLVAKGIIVPTFSSKHMISFIMKKFPLFTSSNNDFDPDILAFYNNEDGRIYILIDSNISNILGHVKNDIVGSLAVHELMHLFCAKKPNIYLKYFEVELVMFYTEAFKMIFNADVPRNIVSEMVRTFCLKYEFKTQFTLREPVNYIFDKIKKFTNIPDKELFSIVVDYVASWYHDTNDKNNLQFNEFMKFHMVFHSVYNKYFHIDVKNKDCLQEALTTSEVIATLAENGELLNSVKKISQYLEKIYSR